MITIICILPQSACTVTIGHRIPFENTFYKHVCSDSNVFCQYYPENFCDLEWKIKFNLKDLQ